MGGRSRLNSVEEYSASSFFAYPPFATFIDLCSCNFQAVESFTAQMNQFCLKREFCLNYMYITIYFSRFVCFVR